VVCGNRFFFLKMRVFVLVSARNQSTSRRFSALCDRFYAISFISDNRSLMLRDFRCDDNIGIVGDLFILKSNVSLQVTFHYTL